LTGVVQFCSPQWVITDSALISVGGPAEITLPFDRIKIDDWPRLMAKEPWLDQDSCDSAFESASAMFEAGRMAVRPTDVE
jgi:hypothetical protein